MTFPSIHGQNPPNSQHTNRAQSTSPVHVPKGTTKMPPLNLAALKGVETTLRERHLSPNPRPTHHRTARTGRHNPQHHVLQQLEKHDPHPPTSARPQSSKVDKPRRLDPLTQGGTQWAIKTKQAQVLEGSGLSPSVASPPAEPERKGSFTRRLRYNATDPNIRRPSQQHSPLLSVRGDSSSPRSPVDREGASTPKSHRQQSYSDPSSLFPEPPLSSRRRSSSSDRPDLGVLTGRKHGTAMDKKEAAALKMGLQAMETRKASKANLAKAIQTYHGDDVRQYIQTELAQLDSAEDKIAALKDIKHALIKKHKLDSSPIARRTLFMKLIQSELAKVVLQDISPVLFFESQGIGVGDPPQEDPSVQDFKEAVLTIGFNRAMMDYGILTSSSSASDLDVNFYIDQHAAVFDGLNALDGTRISDIQSDSDRADAIKALVKDHLEHVQELLEPAGLLLEVTDQVIYTQDEYQTHFNRNIDSKSFLATIQESVTFISGSDQAEADFRSFMKEFATENDMASLTYRSFCHPFAAKGSSFALEGFPEEEFDTLFSDPLSYSDWNRSIESAISIYDRTGSYDDVPTGIIQDVLRFGNVTPEDWGILEDDEKSTLLTQLKAQMLASSTARTAKLKLFYAHIDTHYYLGKANQDNVPDSEMGNPRMLLKPLIRWMDLFKAKPELKALAPDLANRCEQIGEFLVDMQEFYYQYLQEDFFNSLPESKAFSNRLGRDISTRTFSVPNTKGESVDIPILIGGRFINKGKFNAYAKSKKLDMSYEQFLLEIERAQVTHIDHHYTEIDFHAFSQMARMDSTPLSTTFDNVFYGEEDKGSRSQNDFKSDFFQFLRGHVAVLHKGTQGDMVQELEGSQGSPRNSEDVQRDVFIRLMEPLAKDISTLQRQILPQLAPKDIPPEFYAAFGLSLPAIHE